MYELKDDEVAKHFKKPTDSQAIQQLFLLGKSLTPELLNKVRLLEDGDADDNKPEGIYLRVITRANLEPHIYWLEVNSSGKGTVYDNYNPSKHGGHKSEDQPFLDKLLKTYQLPAPVHPSGDSGFQLALDAIITFGKKSNTYQANNTQSNDPDLELALKLSLEMQATEEVKPQAEAVNSKSDPDLEEAIRLSMETFRQEEGKQADEQEKIRARSPLPRDIKSPPEPKTEPKFLPEEDAQPPSGKKP